MRCCFRKQLALVALLSASLWASDPQGSSYTLRIHLSPPVPHESAMLISLSGQHTEYHLTGHATEIRLRPVPPGSYLLEVNLSHGFVVQRTLELWPHTVNRRGERELLLSTSNARYFADSSSMVWSARQMAAREPGTVQCLERTWRALREQRLEEAHALLRRRLQQSQECAEIWLSLGAVAARMGHLDTSLLFYREALRRQPESFRANLNLSETLLSMGQVKEALEFANRALRIRPDDLLAHMHAATIYLRVRSYSEAIRHLERSVELDTPETDLPRLQLAICYAECGRRSEALRQFQLWLNQHRGHPRHAQVTAVADEVAAWSGAAEAQVRFRDVAGPSRDR